MSFFSLSVINLSRGSHPTVVSPVLPLATEALNLLAPQEILLVFVFLFFCSSHTCIFTAFLQLQSSYQRNF